MAAAEPRRDRLGQGGNPDSSLGATLANDPDQRVRRALAGALAAVPASPRTDPARQQLAADPRFSVRSALYKAERSSTPRHRPPASRHGVASRRCGRAPDTRLRSCSWLRSVRVS